MSIMSQLSLIYLVIRAFIIRSPVLLSINQWYKHSTGDGVSQALQSSSSPMCVPSVGVYVWCAVSPTDAKISAAVEMYTRTQYIFYTEDCELWTIHNCVNLEA